MESLTTIHRIGLNSWFVCSCAPLQPLAHTNVYKPLGWSLRPDLQHLSLLKYSWTIPHVVSKVPASVVLVQNVLIVAEVSSHTGETPLFSQPNVSKVVRFHSNSFSRVCEC